MFDIGFDEMLAIAIVAIVVIGPKDLPTALRTFGRWVAKVRRVSGHFRSGVEFDDPRGRAGGNGEDVARPQRGDHGHDRRCRCCRPRLAGWDWAGRDWAGRDRRLAASRGGSAGDRSRQRRSGARKVRAGGRATPRATQRREADRPAAAPPS